MPIFRTKIVISNLFCFFSLLLSLEPAYGDNEEIKTMVITPSRVEQNIQHVGNSITVITKEEIEEKKFQNVSEILRTVEGLQVTQSGGFGGITSIFLRGSSASQILVMVDSIPVNEVNSGQFDFSDFNTLSIERIEILRGAQSVAYGSSAIGGVINIITKNDSAQTSAQANMEAGSYGTQSYQAGANAKLIHENDKKLSAQIATRWFDTDNISQADFRNGNREKDPYNNTSLHLALKGQMKETNFSANVRYIQGRSQLDTFDFEDGAIDALDFEQQKEMYQSNIQAETKYNIWTPKIILGYNQENYIGKDPNINFNNYQLKSNTTSIQQQNVFTFSQYISSLIGYSYQQNDGSSVGNFDKSRYVNSFFTEQFLHPLETTHITIGGRIDDDSTFGSESTYRASIAQELTSLQSKAHTSYGTAFRAPSFSDLYFPNFSNPELDPETSRGFDFGLSSTFDSFSTDITYFDTYYDDLILFNGQTFLPENIGRARTKGVESKIQFATAYDTDLTVSYTYLDARDITNDVLLPRRARHQTALSVKNSSLDSLLFRSDIVFIADRFDSGMLTLDDFLIVSGTAQYDFSKNIRPYVRVQNAFDRTYQEVRGYGAFGASVFFGVDLMM